MPTTLTVSERDKTASWSEEQNLMNLGVLSTMNTLTQIMKEKKVMNIPDWLIDLQIVSMLCGGISLIFTIVGGYTLIKWLDSLKGDSENESDQE
tara:strand:+ start:74 stop:355 length:282 start_codon:yes stop_codon:yes gene_type:complete